VPAAKNPAVANAMSFVMMAKLDIADETFIQNPL